MSRFMDLAVSIYRRFVIDGMADSGENQPDKDAIIDLMAMIDPGPVEIGEGDLDEDDTFALTVADHAGKKVLYTGGIDATFLVPNDLAAGDDIEVTPTGSGMVIFEAITGCVITPATDGHDRTGFTGFPVALSTTGNANGYSAAVSLFGWTSAAA